MRKLYLNYFEQPRNPLPGDLLFDSLQHSNTIMLAVNPRVTLDSIVGLLQAAKDAGHVVILELALSEMNTDVGYTGLTPSTFALRVKKAADLVGWYGYVLHADHLTVKRGTEDEIKYVKQEIDARIDAGFSSFAVDASFLFKRNALTVEDQLEQVVRTSITLFKHIQERMGSRRYGREGEVGEIGIKEFTEVKEALFFLKKLKENEIDLNCLAIANGSKHGVSVDEEGNIIPQLGINLQRTIEIADAIRMQGFKTGIAQHGITGTPLSLIASKFPKGKIVKGNVATFWMLLVWEILQIFEPELYNKIYNWVIQSYRKERLTDSEIFALNSKYAIKKFFNEIDTIDKETKDVIRAKTYAEALIFFKAFGMENTSKKVYNYIVKNKIEY